MTECKSFKASINKESRILILGSMPGVKSLMAQEYYAHPQNRFWKIMSILCEDNLVGIPYPEKLSLLLKNKIALWDVIANCSREGSLDSAIENEKPNDIRALLKKYPNIRLIGLNGMKAYSAFNKYFKDIAVSDKYEIYKLPSTSPANAKFQIPQLILEWENLKSVYAK